MHNYTSASVAAAAEELPRLRQEEERLKSALVATGTSLSAARRRASGHLRQAVEASLQQLAMAQSRFDVRIGWEASQVTSSGANGNGGVQTGRMHVPLFIGDEAHALGSHSRRLLLMMHAMCTVEAR